VRKIISTSIIIGVIILFVGASATASISTTKTDTNHIEPVTMTQPPWFENFDTYTNGQWLDGFPEDGGWRGWDNLSAAGAAVTNAQSRSSPHSLDISGPSDTIYEFPGFNNDGVYTSGFWNFSAWVYVPDDFEGESYFLVQSAYTDGAGQGNSWAIQVRMDSAAGVVEAEHDGWQLPLVTGRWAEFLVEIDLDNDYYWLWYDGTVLEDKEWTAGPNNDMLGYLEIDCLDLYANGATSVYYDDLALYPWGAQSVPDLQCTGYFNWSDVEGGATVTADFNLVNAGTAGSLLDWQVDSYPSWGTWTFNPSSGAGLTPAAGIVNVQVSCVAPSDANQEFTGSIKVVNLGDPSDFCTIQVRLATPRNKQVTPMFLQFLERLAEQFPILEQILA
jgi:hypothetical protein